MSKSLLFLTLLLIGLNGHLFAQAPHAFNYQAELRDATGVIQANTLTDFKIEILQDNNSIYAERHLDQQTDAFGKVSFKIGQGSNPTADFSKIDWSTGQLQIQVAINGQVMGRADLVAVPFALYAQKSGDAHWEKDESTGSLSYQNGSVGIGAATPLSTFHVKSSGWTNAIFESTGDIQDASIYLKNKHRTWRLHGDQSDQDKFKISQFRNYGQDLTLQDAFVITSNGNIGIGVSNPSEKLVIGEDIGDVTGTSSAIVIGKKNNTGFSKLIFGEDQDHWGSLYWRNSKRGDTPNSFAFQMKTSPNENAQEVLTIRQDGVTEVKVLQINGGADITEKVMATETIQPGEVIVIDTSNPNHAKRSTTAYDKKVIGIVSGAGGVQQGMELTQTGVFEGNTAFAIAGRVYVKVIGDVEPGDLLTTSAVAGHAMKAKNRKKRDGAVIGKALSTVTDEGLVLVLVNLQ